MPNKLSIEEVRDIFAKHGCELLDREYEGVSQSLYYRCKCGEIGRTSIYGLRNRKGCRKCSGNAERKYTLQEAREIFANKGCELLEAIYVNNNVPMQYKCICGNMSRIRLADFVEGVRCQHCKGRFNSENNRTDNDEISKFCDENGCKLLEAYIDKNRTRIKYVCKCGNETEAYLCNFKRFPNCKKCGNKKVSGDKCHLWNPDREAVAERKKWAKAASRMLRRCLKKTGDIKQKHTHEILGYTYQELQRHIQNHTDYSADGVHIDHIFPIKAFLDYGIKDMKIINHLSNLRPMNSISNREKGDKYDEATFRLWLKNLHS